MVCLNYWYAHMQRCIIHTPKCCVFIFIYVIYLLESPKSHWAPSAKKFNNRELPKICLLYKDVVCLFKLMRPFDRDAELANRRESYICLNWSWRLLWNSQRLTNFPRARTKEKYSKIHQTLNDLDKMKYSSSHFSWLINSKHFTSNYLLTPYFESCLQLLLCVYSCK